MPPTDKQPVEPRPMPVIVKTLGGIKRLRRVEYRIVRMPEKVGRVQLGKPPKK
jgi:hypothetical protein